ncbi:MAG: hypothetical protein N838_24655 [Thiohalocapsa sp. PB-PSB1]|nr:MAG: hypothetical protein N838_14125 [Thiohalocapsa sp. PB-PSB1]QQO56068.1 MAG: hypothetical protein N838_24655 [Thiohalocapsa sp. PB-PSB1]
MRNENAAIFSDKLHFKLLHMPLFQKQEHELETHFDKWRYFFEHLSKSYARAPNSPIRAANSMASTSKLCSIIGRRRWIPLGMRAESVEKVEKELKKDAHY